MAPKQPPCAYHHVANPLSLLRNLFKGNNIYKDKEDKTSQPAKSLQMLQSDFGGTENLFLALRTDVIVSTDGRATPRLTYLGLEVDILFNVCSVVLMDRKQTWLDVVQSK